MTGLLTVDMVVAYRARTGEQIHVHVDGRDVTNCCFRADPSVGYAMVYCLDPEHHDPSVQTGPKHLMTNWFHMVCTHRLEGVITITSEAQG